MVERKREAVEVLWERRERCGLRRDTKKDVRKEESAGRSLQS